MMIDDERTELRRDVFPVEEATRAVDRAEELARPGEQGGRRAEIPAPAPAGRLARVPGATADDAAYGIRRASSHAPVTRAAAEPGTVTRRRAGAPRTRRGPRIRVAVLLAVAAFALVLAAAAVVLVLLVAS